MWRCPSMTDDNEGGGGGRADHRQWQGEEVPTWTIDSRRRWREVAPLTIHDRRDTRPSTMSKTLLIFDSNHNHSHPLPHLSQTSMLQTNVSNVFINLLLHAILTTPHYRYHRALVDDSMSCRSHPTSLRGLGVLCNYRGCFQFTKKSRRIPPPLS